MSALIIVLPKKSARKFADEFSMYVLQKDEFSKCVFQWGRFWKPYYLVKGLGTIRRKAFGVGGVPGHIAGKHGKLPLNEDRGRMRHWGLVGVQVFGCKRIVEADAASRLRHLIFQNLSRHLQWYVNLLIPPKRSQNPKHSPSIPSPTIQGLNNKRTTPACFVLMFVLTIGS